MNINIYLSNAHSMQAYSNIEDEDLLYLCGQDISHKGSIHKKISLIRNYNS